MLSWLAWDQQALEPPPARNASSDPGKLWQKVKALCVSLLGMETEKRFFLLLLQPAWRQVCFPPEHAVFIWQLIHSAASPSLCFMSHFCTFSMKWDIFGCNPGIKIPWGQVGPEFSCSTSAQGHLVQPLAFNQG